MKLLERKNKKGNNVFIGNEYKLICMNNMIDICTDACSICWDKPVSNDIKKRFEYISNKIKIGHESIIEHSNMIILFIVNNSNYKDIIKFISCCKYINAKVVFDKNRAYILTGGSIRGYKHIYRTIDDQKNTILSILTKAIYQNCPYCFFEDFINDNIMNINRFIAFEENVVNGEPNTYHPVESVDPDKIEIVNFDRIDEKYYDMLISLGFDPVDILDMISCTVLFKNMGRAGTHQLVRHRNGITQESQRYVDYSNAGFSSPDEFKDKYNPETTYEIGILDNKYTMKELGKILSSVYEDLRNQGVDKEDARGYLPFNTQCNKLYMTFTIKNLMMFLKLRCARGAQAEIRKYANITFDSINKDNKYKSLEDFISNNLDPSYSRKYNGANGEDLYANIDEVISESAETRND